MSLHELESIRNQSQQPDWSAQIVKGATFDDLDSKAISIARSLYTAKNKKNAAEIAEWDDITFLNKAKLTIKGKITNATIVLLGKEESEVLISPAVARYAGYSKTHKERSGIMKLKVVRLSSPLKEFHSPYNQQRIERQCTGGVYRNPFLARAMVGLQMVDTIGSGIRKMFNFQRQRLFPLPRLYH